jgi:hypothetical protein
MDLVKYQKMTMLAEVTMNRSETPANAITPAADTATNGAPPKPGNPQWSRELEIILADERWVQEQFNQGALEAYEGQFVVVLDRQVITSAPKYRQALKKAAKQRDDIPLTRFAIMYVPKPE